MGIPVVIEEQDVHPGLTTRLLASAAQKICLAYEETAQHFANVPEKIIVTGNPVRGDLLSVSREEARERWELPADVPVVLVFGGSQGARAINDALLQIYPALMKQNIYLLWQTGSRDYARVNQLLPEHRPEIKLLEYIDDMPAAYAAADVVVSRAGAITLAELAIVQKPAILIPYPFAAGNHQYKNARMIEARGAAVTITQGENFKERLLETLLELIADEERREKMHHAWKALARPQAADTIARVILQVAGRGVEKKEEMMVKAKS